MEKKKVQNSSKKKKKDQAFESYHLKENEANKPLMKIVFNILSGGKSLHQPFLFLL